MNPEQPPIPPAQPVPPTQPLIPQQPAAGATAPYTSASPATPQPLQPLVSNPAMQTSAPAADYLHPNLPQKKAGINPRKLMVILVVIVVLCLLVVGGLIALTFLPEQKAKKVTTAQKPTTSSQMSLSAKDTIDQVKVYFKGTATAKTPMLTPVKAPNMTFYTVIPDIAPLTSVAGEVAADTAAQQVNSITHALENNGYTKRVLTDGKTTTSAITDYFSDKTTCQVADIRQADAKLPHTIEAKCLDQSQYVEYAKAQQPFVMQYTPAVTASGEYGFVGKPAPRASRTAGYQLLDIQVSTVIDRKMTSDGRFAQYYQTPDGLWYYFLDRDHTTRAYCDKYITIQQRSAYAGEPCTKPGDNKLDAVKAPNTK